MLKNRIENYCLFPIFAAIMKQTQIGCIRSTLSTGAQFHVKQNKYTLWRSTNSELKQVRNLERYISPLSRVLIVNIFLIDGINKIFIYENVEEWMFFKGVPEASLPFVIAFEIIGALAIMVGWQTKLFSVLFFLFCILTAIIFHSDFSNSVERISFMKNISMAGGFIFLFLYGGGSFSLDDYLHNPQDLEQPAQDQL